MSNDSMINKADMSRIAKEGTAIYQTVKDQYEPQCHGKYVAIDPGSKEVFFGNTSVEAVESGKKKYPDVVFYLQKIGFDTAVSIANHYKLA